MISSESRMRENRTSGLMSGGLETRPWGAGLRPGAKATDIATGPYTLGAPVLDSTHRHIGDAPAGGEVADGRIGAQPADDLSGVESERHDRVSLRFELMTKVDERAGASSRPRPAHLLQASLHSLPAACSEARRVHEASRTARPVTALVPTRDRGRRERAHLRNACGEARSRRRQSHQRDVGSGSPPGQGAGGRRRCRRRPRIRSRRRPTRRPSPIRPR